MKKDDVVKRHHLVDEVQSHLRTHAVSVINENPNYDRDINTEAILKFIKQDKGIIKSIILHKVYWFDHQDKVLEYFDDAVGEYDVDVVIDALRAIGIKSRSERCFDLYAILPFYPAILITVFIAIAYNMAFAPSVMIFILLYASISLIPFTYVYTYESKRERVK